MVVTLAPATEPTGVMQDLVARPSTCTVHAPHWPMPQPNLVPVRPSSSRMTQSSGESSGLRAVTVRPLSLKVVMERALLFRQAGQRADAVARRAAVTWDSRSVQAGSWV